MGSKRIPRATKRKNIPKIKADKNVKRSQLPVNGGFTFYSSYPWIHAVDLYKDLSFTNMCKSKEQFADEIVEILTEVIPKVYQDWEAIFNSGGRNGNFRHCHTLKDSQLEVSKKVAEKIHDTTFDEENSWWEIGFSGGARIIGIYDAYSKTFYPLFIDRHHLIFPSKNYNTVDYKKLTYNPKKI